MSLNVENAESQQADEARLTVFRYKLKPVREDQWSIIQQSLGCQRWVYNQGVALQKQRMSQGEKRLPYKDLCKALTGWKKDQEWLGTPRKVLDARAGPTRWDWDAKEPFGHQAPNETPTTELPAFAFDLRFPGQRYDEATGLFQNGFRDYHAGLGRYVQSDPLGLEAGWNTYGYVSSSPLLDTDPLGLIQAGSYRPMEGEPTLTRCKGGLCVKLQPGTMLTDKGNPFKVYKRIWGDNRYDLNCHGYAFGVDIWVEDPMPVYKDEYEIVLSSQSPELILWMGSDGKPKHTSVVRPFVNFGKNGTLPIAPDPSFIHGIRRAPIYYRRKNP